MGIKGVILIFFLLLFNASSLALQTIATDQRMRFGSWLKTM
jgi:hypothetical protein